MREILFRGKQFDGTWFEGFLVKTNDSVLIVFDDCYDEDLEYNFEGNIVSVIPETVSQYTGLKDKNGTKIFDGDIISVNGEIDDDIFLFCVRFGECGGTQNVTYRVGYNGFFFEQITKQRQIIRDDPLYWINGFECEVIGNIYDNPELLKEDN